MSPLAAAAIKSFISKPEITWERIKRMRTLRQISLLKQTTILIVVFSRHSHHYGANVEKYVCLPCRCLDENLVSLNCRSFGRISKWFNIELIKSNIIPKLNFENIMYKKLNEHAADWAAHWSHLERSLLRQLPRVSVRNYRSQKNSSFLFQDLHLGMWSIHLKSSAVVYFCNNSL